MVVLPAPFGPSRPKHSPAAMSNEMPAHRLDGAVALDAGRGPRPRRAVPSSKQELDPRLRAQPAEERVDDGCRWPCAPRPPPRPHGLEGGGASAPPARTPRGPSYGRAPPRATGAFSSSCSTSAATVCWARSSAWNDCGSMPCAGEELRPGRPRRRARAASGRRPSPPRACRPGCRGRAPPAASSSRSTYCSSARRSDLRLLPVPRPRPRPGRAPTFAIGRIWPIRIGWPFTRATTSGTGLGSGRRRVACGGRRRGARPAARASRRRAATARGGRRRRGSAVMARRQAKGRAAARVKRPRAALRCPGPCSPSAPAGTCAPTASPSASPRSAPRERGVLDLTESNPTRAGLAVPGGPARPPRARRGAGATSPRPFGLPAARAAVAADFARRGFPRRRPTASLLSASTSEAYAFLFKLLCDPGDEVLVPRPGYPLFEFLADARVGAGRAPTPSRHDGEWHLDLAALRAARRPAHARDRRREPEQPDRRLPEARRARRARRRCAPSAALALVSDEVFADFAFRDDPRRARERRRATAPALAFALGGLSKSCGLPQLKLAWTAVTGPGGACAGRRSRASRSWPTPTSRSRRRCRSPRPALLARREELQAPIREPRPREPRGRCAPRRARLPGHAPRARRAAGTPCCACPATLSEEERVTRLLEERDVLVHPGYFFDFPHEAYLVLSLLPPGERLRRGRRPGARGPRAITAAGGSHARRRAAAAA